MSHRGDSKKSGSIGGDNLSTVSSSTKSNTIAADRQSQASSCASMQLNTPANLSLILQNATVIFESPVKRKCLIKAYRKPRFSQWKTYWLQVCAGDLLVYYAAKTLSFRSTTTSSDMPQNATMMTNASATPAADSTMIVKDLYSEQRRQQFQKQPCKMHRVTNWMVVNLFSDKEKQIMEARGRLLTASSLAGANTNNKTTTADQRKQLQRDKELVEDGCCKFDIQLNDLTQGTNYKYRFDTLELAQEWLAQFNAAATYQERLKPDNLIKFEDE